MRILNKIKEIFKKNTIDLIVIILAMIFFIFSSFFINNKYSDDFVRWSSPDETANYYFTNLYSQGEGLSVFDNTSLYSSGWVSPRSMRVDQGMIKPVSFPGIMLIFGSIAAFLGIQTIPYLSSFFAALGIIVFFYLIKNIFNKRIALSSAFILASFPVYIYYSIRSMFHNILFIFLLLSSLYLLSTVIDKRKIKIKGIKIKEFFVSFKESFSKFLNLPNRKESWKFVITFFSGLFLGLALITRTSEILWILPTFFIIYLFYFRRISITKVLLFLAGIFLGLLPGLVSNQYLYNSPISGGYNEMNVSINEISDTGKDFSIKTLFNKSELQNFYDKIVDNVFYFGVKPRQSLDMFNSYVIKMFPFLFWFSVLGLIVFISRNFKRLKKKHIVYLVSGFFLSLFLILYYGSWLFNDNPDLSQTTIGNSYTRYWLPIYLFLIPLAAYFLHHFSLALFSKKYFSKRLRSILIFGFQALLILLFIINSFSFVLFSSSESLIYWKYSSLSSNKSADLVISQTEEDAVIITKYHDKLLFPERRVIVATFPDDDLSAQVQKLIEKYPVYYYHFQLPEKDMVYLNERRLLSYGLNIYEKMRIDESFSLYEIIKISDIEKIGENNLE